MSERAHFILDKMCVRISIIQELTQRITINCSALCDRKNGSTTINRVLLKYFTSILPTSIVFVSSAVFPQNSKWLKYIFKLTYPIGKLVSSGSIGRSSKREKWIFTKAFNFDIRLKKIFFFLSTCQTTIFKSATVR